MPITDGRFSGEAEVYTAFGQFGGPIQTGVVGHADGPDLATVFDGDKDWPAAGRARGGFLSDRRGPAVFPFKARDGRAASTECMVHGSSDGLQKNR